jgi:hypothetical protein
VNPVLENIPVPIEPLGPPSRRSSIVISEIMYHPADRPDEKNLEFVELYNSQPYYEDISGWRLSGTVEFTFPEGTIIAGGGFLVIAAAPGGRAVSLWTGSSARPYSEFEQVRRCVAPRGRA